MSAPVLHRSIDDALGPGADRFFGSRYRDVHQSLRLREATVDGESVRVSGSMAIDYPAAWSSKGERSVTPHVSTIDGAVTAALLGVELLRCATTAAPEQITGAWIDDLGLRAGGSPQEDATTVPVRAAVRTDPESAGSGLVVRAELGSMRIDFTLRVPGGIQIEQVPRTLTAAPVGGTAYHGSEVALTDVALDLGRDTASATLTVPVRRDDSAYRELAGRYPDSLGDVQHVVAVAQVAQALLYELDGVPRSRSNTLWMRSYRALRTAAPTPLSDAEQVRVAVEDHSVVEMDGHWWSLSEWSASCAGVASTFDVAHRLPEGGAR
ncbi:MULTISPECIES: AvrD family protein [Tsukamurella]|uniref:AvrD family protein n=1 Tax=Tsukamurella strandjordii TaxID=147577 RepID=A0AA90NAM7_9ACTN|nr:MULTISPECIES: AvrD family protein [Tsukamurella]MDP0396987.1 AvrD family protein [Tsukamurella strandjordii]GIZ96789.1 hypothetical protein TTY48_14010 [Tsukamurella sp. TY48]